MTTTSIHDLKDAAAAARINADKAEASATTMRSLLAKGAAAEQPTALMEAVLLIAKREALAAKWAGVAYTADRMADWDGTLTVAHLLADLARDTDLKRDDAWSGGAASNELRRIKADAAREVLATVATWM